MEMPFIGKWNQGAPTFNDYIAFMDSIGFTPFDVIEEHRMTNQGAGVSRGHPFTFLFQVDFVFVRKEGRFANAVQAIIDAKANSTMSCTGRGSCAPLAS